MKPLLYSALPTPFDDSNKIDLSVLSTLLDRLSNTHDGVVIAGSTGEGESLELNEVQSLLDFIAPFKLDKILAINEDVTDKVLKAIQSLYIPENIKILLRVPAYILPTQKGIYLHFLKVFNTFSKTQFFIYNIPKRTGSKIEAETVQKLHDICQNFIGVKDCSCDETFVKTISSFTSVYCGVDDRYIDYLSWGAVGLISVESLLYPNIYFELGENFQRGITNQNLLDFIRARYFKSLDLPNPIPLKASLKKLGFSSMNLRLPLCY